MYCPLGGGYENRVTLANCLGEVNEVNWVCPWEKLSGDRSEELGWSGGGGTAISKEAIEEVPIDQDHDGQDAVRGHQ